MAEIIRIKKGLDIPLSGGVAKDAAVGDDTLTTRFAISPDDYPGFRWKLKVKIGDKVSKGDALLMDKEQERIALVAPVSGTVAEVRRGERRKIEAVVVEKEADAEQSKFLVDNADVVATLCKSGLWALLRQRPYDIIPDPDKRSRDIFITAFDTAPLAGEVLSADLRPWLEKGIEVLSGLTDGKVYLDTAFGSGLSSHRAVVTEFRGPHPAGNVGVQIANIKPVNKDEIVWALDARTAARIGRLFGEQELDYSTVVALTGSEVKEPRLVKTLIGAALKTLLVPHLEEKPSRLRVVSGNVLTGIQVSPEDGFLRYPYRQITVIPEGDDADEFMGWASINPSKFSVKRSFPTFLHGKRPFSFDARVKGGHRAMILSGEYDKVFPMDIYPEYLIKAIEAGDIDRMEKLGIYEVAPEDFALPEFVDTSKLPLQQIVREGLDNLRKELS